MRPIRSDLCGVCRGRSIVMMRPPCGSRCRWASIWDVIVDPDYQGQDIGTQIMQRILQHPDLKQVELFWLCTRDKQTFYEKLGFSANEQTGMVRARAKHARLE